MRQVTVILAATSFLALGLACGGGGGGLGLSGGSARAKELCAHLDGANASKWNPGVSCTALAVGTEPEIQGTRVKVLSVRSFVGKDSLPEIQNMDERSAFSKTDGKALAVEVEYTNMSPVRSKVTARLALHTGGGEHLMTWPYNSEILVRQAGEGYEHLWDGPKLGPGKSLRTFHVFAVPPGDEEGSVLQLYAMEKRVDEKDPRGRKRDFFTDFYIQDLPAIEGL